MKLFSAAVIVALSVALCACGGSREQTASPKSDTASAVASSVTHRDLMQGQSEGLGAADYGIAVEGVDKVLMLQRLSKKFNGRFAHQPEALMGQRLAHSAAKSLESAAKDGSKIPASVHRFFNTLTGVHFYTISDAERSRVLQTLPHFNYEGPAFFSLTAADAPLSPVFRFYSIYTGAHFYTISPEERDYVTTNYSEYFTLEGIAWYATLYSGPGWVPMYRFYNTETGTHFYTTSEEERSRVIRTIPIMEYEGIGYYVRSSGEALPVSPISPSNDAPRLPCISEATGSAYVECGAVGALPESTHIEGRRGSQLLFSGSEECLYDGVTGLYWENKSAGRLSPRYSARSRFTHFDQTDRPQVMDTLRESIAPFNVLSVPRVPSQAEIDASDNSVAYVNFVNSIALCGFSDWRIPSASELANVVNFGYPSFRLPNVEGARYLSADTASWEFESSDLRANAVRRRIDGVVTVGYDSQFPFFPTYGDVTVEYRYRGAAEGGVITPASRYGLVLVHGTSVPAQPRFHETTIAYGKDAPNNVLVDAWSHLQWRRCVEGQIWTGSTCVGTPLKLTAAQALAGSASRWGWRLPGIKELETLYVRNADPTRLQMDSIRFPLGGLDQSDLGFWSMTLNRFMGWVSDPPGTSGLTHVDKVTVFRASFEGTPLGKPTATIEEVPVTDVNYVRLLRVFP